MCCDCSSFKPFFADQRQNFANQQSRFRLSGRVRRAVEPVANAREPQQRGDSFCTTININAFRRVLGRIVLASTTTARPLRLTISPSHFCKWHYTQRPSLFTASTGARPERNGVLSAGAEYSRRSINKTQRRKAKQRTAFFPRARARFSYLLAPLVAPFRDLRRETALSHGFLPSYETRRTMRVSMLLPPPRYSRCSITGICHSCFAVTASEKALLTRSRWVKVMCRAIYIFYTCSNFTRIKVQMLSCSITSIVRYRIRNLLDFGRTWVSRAEKENSLDFDYLFEEYEKRARYFL